jgi:hypothetical protein
MINLPIPRRRLASVLKSSGWHKYFFLFPLGGEGITTKNFWQTRDVPILITKSRTPQTQSRGPRPL